MAEFERLRVETQSSVLGIQMPLGDMTVHADATVDETSPHARAVDVWRILVPDSARLRIAIFRVLTRDNPAYELSGTLPYARS